MTDQDYASRLNQHYTPADLAAAFDAVLRSWGKGEGPLTPDDLAPLELARLAQVGPGTRVLDVGGGFGGPARTLAAAFGCKVTVLDLTEEYCRVGEILSARTGLSDHVAFQHGSALDIPFGDETFDLVWTQHSTMNIADKQRLYQEIYRVTRPGGKHALFEIMAGPNPPVLYPVPWAMDESLSFLSPPADVRQTLVGEGFTVERWDDLTATVGSLVPARPPNADAAGAPPPPGLQLILGPGFGERLRNMIRNLVEQRTLLVRGVSARG
jgi:ubiquinone/menaquinone biosynthesis C-methylase UbiE